MIPINSSLLTTLLGVAAYLFGLAIFVQVIQEIYKYLTSSKTRAYTNALFDYLGPWAIKLKESNLNLTARSPFQIRRLKPGSGLLLPIGKEQLIAGLEKTAPPWIRKTNQALKQEVRLQKGKDGSPSPIWQEFLKELGKVEKGTSGYWNAFEISQWLDTWNHTAPDKKDPDKTGERIAPKSLNAAELLEAFKNKFLPHIREASENFVQFNKNFEYSYGRRNLRQTFLISIIITLAFNMPIQRIYQRAKNLSPQEAAALATNVIQAYNTVNSVEDISKPETQTLKDIKEKWDYYIESLTEQEKRKCIFVTTDDLDRIHKNRMTAIIVYFFQCLLTALLICFGAPLWNDIATILLRVQQGKSKNPLPAANTEEK